MTTITRRRMLGSAGLAAGALLVGFHVPPSRGAGRGHGGTLGPGQSFAPNAFIRIRRGEPITFVMPQAEMGQGIYTAHAMILAEELDANFGGIAVEASPPSDALYGNPIFHIQVTGNSNSVRAFWTSLRTAGATARAILVAAAADLWGVAPESCRTESGFVIHPASGRRRDYGALAARAARQRMPSHVPLKSPDRFTIIGRPMKRLDTPAKVNGSATYGIDALPVGVKFAVLAACPVFGGRLLSARSEGAERIPGVRKVIALEDLVAVVADHTWAAKQGLAALQLTWDESPGRGVDSASIWASLAEASEDSGTTVVERGAVDRTLTAVERLEAVYQLPLLAHATMEPMNCTVHVRPDACELWLGSQVQARVQAAAARVTSLPLERVVVHNHLLGCGLGRRLEIDMVEKAVRIGRHHDGPVKVIWTREEDIRHDLYRPAYYDRLTAGIRDGRLVAWNHRITGSAVFARWFPSVYTHNIDIDAVDSAIDMPYTLENFRVQFVRQEPATVPTGFWRGVGPNNNVFAIESFIDEIAAHLHRDPLAFRLEILERSPRLKSALELAARKIGWGESLARGIGRGIAVQPSFGSFIATIVEAEVDDTGVVRVRRVVSAVDTGIVINPDTVAAQLQGGLVVGLTAALYGEVTVRGGRIEQGNFNDYRLMRIDEMPEVEVHLIPSSEAPGGIGETGATAGPPALCNAIYAATGVRIRRLPIGRTDLSAKSRA